MLAVRRMLDSFSPRTVGMDVDPGPFREDFMAGKPLIGINTDYRSTRKEHAALSKCFIN